MASVWGGSWGGAWGNAWGVISSAGDAGSKRKKYIVKDKILYATARELAAYLSNLGVEPENVKQAVSKPNKRADKRLETETATPDSYGFNQYSLDVSALFGQYDPIPDQVAKAIALLMQQFEDEEDDIECLLMAA